MRVKKNYLFFLFCLLPFLEMPRISLFSSINNVFLLLKLASTAGIALYCIESFVLTRKIPFSKVGLCVIIYELCIVLSTFLHKGELMSAISDGLALLVPVLLFDIFIKRFGLRQLLIPIIVVYCGYALITFFQELWLGLPIEYYNNNQNYKLIIDEYGFIFALGHMKRFIFFLMPMIIFGILIADPKKNTHKIGIIFLILLSFGVLLQTWAVSAMIVVLLIIILYIIYNSHYSKKFFKLINYKRFFIFYIILNVLLVSGTLLSMLEPILTMLGKTTTLSGRTIIWEIGIKMISRSSFIGYGVNSEYLKSNLDGLSHFHNLLLNITYTGGIAALFIFILINYFVGKKLINHSENKFANAISIGLYANFILALTDTPDYNMAFVFFVIAYHVDHIYINKSELYCRTLKSKLFKR